MTLRWTAVLGAAVLAASTGCASLGGAKQSKSDPTAAQSSVGQNPGDAQKAAQEEQKGSSAVQRDPSEQQKPQDSRESWRDQKTVSGRVIEATATTLRVRSSSQGEMDLSLSDRTALRVNGHTAKSEQIQPGDEVRASYQMVDGKPIAVRVDVRSRRSSGSSSSGASTDGSASGASGSTGIGADPGAKTPSTDPSTGTPGRPR
jgi:RNase P/RNase MRP subunit p29